MKAERCPQHHNLDNEVQTVLQKLVELTGAQLKAFREQNDREFMRLDKELENAMGEKERAIGALQQHMEEHGCHF